MADPEHVLESLKLPTTIKLNTAWIDRPGRKVF